MLLCLGYTGVSCFVTLKAPKVTEYCEVAARSP
jgi:hypothetical protein